MNESPTIRRLTERPFGAAQDPAKPAPTQVQRTAVAGAGAALPAPTTSTVQRPARTLGDTHTWTPTLNSGTDRTGAPVYDNASIRRLETRQPALSPSVTGTVADPSEVQRSPVVRRLEPTVVPSMAPAVQQAAVRTLDPAPVNPPPTTAPQVQAATSRAVGGINANTSNTRSRITSALLNPMGNDAELLRRLENSQRSAAGRGSPQARRLLAQPYLDALGVANKADVEGMTAGNQAFGQAPALESAAHEGAARRRLDADTFNVDAGYRERALATEAATRRAELERPSLETDAGGNLLRITGATATPVTGADGAPVRAQQRQATPRDPQAEADDRMLAELLDIQKDSYGEYPADALEIARRQLAELRGGQRGGAAQVPEVGATLDGYHFLGGDPSDPANWEAE